MLFINLNSVKNRNKLNCRNDKKQSNYDNNRRTSRVIFKNRFFIIEKITLFAAALAKEASGGLAQLV